MSEEAPVNFLLVDDVPQNLEALEALLAHEGLRLFKAHSGAQALELMLEHDFALALLDVQMPEMDGFELAEIMRSTERTRAIPIIFLTAVATDEMRRFRGYEAGAVDYLLKPIDTRMLRSKTDVFYELSRQRQILARQRDELRDTADRLATTLNRLTAHRDNSPLAIVEFEPDLRLISWTRGAERLFGWSPDAVLGRHAGTIGWMDVETAGAVTRHVAALTVGGEHRDMQVHSVRRADGMLLECEFYYSLLLDRSGKPVSVSAQILDVTERRRAEETQHLLIGELNHRVKNTLASVQAIAFQTLKGAPSPAEFADKFTGRLQALAQAHSLLSRQTWQSASLSQLVQDQLDLGTIDEGRCSVSGPAVELPPNLALHLALVLHELGTNAAKYGEGGNSGPHPNGRDRFLLGAAKHGLGRRDVHPCVNLFKGATIAADGAIMPHAADIARLAAIDVAAGRFVAAADAQPIYLRNKIAFTSAERQVINADKAAAAAAATIITLELL